MGVFNWLRKAVSTAEAQASPAEAPGSAHGTSMALDQTPRGDILRRRGNAFLAEGKLDEASRSYREAIAANRQDADACLNLGFVLGEQQRYQEAEQALRRSLDINPALADAFYFLGLMARKQGKTEAAIENFVRVLELKRDFEIVYGDLCQMLLESGQIGRAKEILLKGIAAYPEMMDFHAQLGGLYAYENDLERAIDCFQEALKLQPDHAQVHSRLGDVFRRSNRFEDALASYDKLVALNPNSAEAFNDRGIALGGLNRHEDALASFEQALALEPRHANALGNLGAMLACLRRHDEAARAIARLIDIEPEYPYALGALFYSKRYSCDWSQYETDLERLNAAVMTGEKAIEPFTFLAATQSAAALLQCARTHAAEACPPSDKPLWGGQRYTHDRIRVAYLSADFHDHATAYLMAELFELHDHERFEIVALSFGPDSTGAMRQRLLRSFDRFVDVRTKSDREAAGLLRDMEIDIAVDLKGFTTDGRPGILAQRPAPVQVNYLGFPGSMGMDCVDYILADHCVIPDGHQHFYAEKIVCLPDSYQPNDAQRQIAEAMLSREECGLPATGFVFCCFNNNYKITPEVFDVWMRLLTEVSGSVLWLLQDNEAVSRNLRSEALRRGVAAERLVFAPRLELDKHLARHKLADLFLDTLPYNAHTTASDALWAGLPVLTCMGTTFPGRVAASLLSAVGLPEMITESLADYEALALKLATRPDLLSDIRARLWRNRSEYPLFDTKRFCSHIESAYTLMWERHQRGDSPASFTVPAVPSRIDRP
ncbi:tetratricopeptide repeat protein [Polaromonas sp. YR568]|uniref:O-linked N-acetylglucosamine transferase family protein n=1 Tax=Polaromonas sp. YR568 TaxID=1855301 RepID=UPI00398C0635